MSSKFSKRISAKNFKCISTKLFKQISVKKIQTDFRKIFWTDFRKNSKWIFNTFSCAPSLGPKCPTDAAEGCSLPQESEKVAHRAAIFLVYINNWVVWENVPRHFIVFPSVCQSFIGTPCQGPGGRFIGQVRLHCEVVTDRLAPHFLSSSQLQPTITEGCFF